MPRRQPPETLRHAVGQIRLLLITLCFSSFVSDTAVTAIMIRERRISMDLAKCCERGRHGTTSVLRGGPALSPD